MNLFKSEPRVYKIHSSEREVYETERYYLLKVVDFSGRLEKELPKMGWNDGIDEFLKELFEAQQNCKVSKMIMKLFDTDRFCVETSITEEYRGTSIVIVKVTKRRIREKVAEKVFLILKTIFDRGDDNFYHYNF